MCFRVLEGYSKVQHQHRAKTKISESFGRFRAQYTQCHGCENTGIVAGIAAGNVGCSDGGVFLLATSLLVGSAWIDSMAIPAAVPG